ncbi:GNAT family N-acetyltransferase [Streptomyces alboniger]|uniref:N-acetyltransferase n=1 Tax=Streptomyces alboniger TaxID=132473 RepID=A0A5J6HNZ5_STRAD|nr:GNAT family protein [Streptomyces alboniger]QEV18735.1 N-acetyltransferase [Streptomyces alboniger]
MRDYVEVPGQLVLRPWSLRDRDSLVAAFKEPEMGRQADQPVDTPTAAADWIERRAGRWADGSEYSFAVTGADGVVLGNVAVGAVDRVHGIGWVSYWTTSGARGQGVATRACVALADWAFEDAGLFRLELGHRVNNPASCRVAMGAGFTIEGRERQKLVYDGTRYDVELHARLASDPFPI